MKLAWGIDPVSVMVDLETVGTAPNAGILEIAAAAFNEWTGEIIDRFSVVTFTARYLEGLYQELGGTGSLLDTDYDREALQSAVNCLQAGIVSTDTLKWWRGTFQGHNCWTESTDDSPSSGEATVAFAEWIQPYANGRVYCQGMFDLPILSYELTQEHTTVPWKFWLERDLRTLRAEHPEVDIPKPEDAHNAMADVEYQIQCLTAIRRLQGAPEDPDLPDPLLAEVRQREG